MVNQPQLTPLDVLAVGEALVDCISDAGETSLDAAHRFTMYPGGAVANVAMNIARLGGVVALAACTGEDSLGAFLRRHIEAAGVQTRYLRAVPGVPTTLAVVTSNEATPDFVIYRGADACLASDDLSLAQLGSTAIVHTTAFAISTEPASSAIIDFMARAAAAGCLVSFDPNYHPRLWNIAADPLALIERLCPFVSIVKPSMDDCVRLFGEGLESEDCAERFLRWGVRHVVLTMGASGVLLAGSQGMTRIPAPPVKVVDVTGAGDSFWAGLLIALRDGYKIADAVRVGQAVAAIKLQHVGPLQQSIARRQIYEQLGLPSPADSQGIDDEYAIQH